MNFSADYLYESFRTAYREGLNAKERGDYAVARKKLLDAADFLARLAVVSSTGEREERAAQAKRLKAVAEAMPKVAASAAPRYGQTGASQSWGEESDAGAFAAKSEGGEEYFTFLQADEVDVSFDDVIGLEEAKAAVTEYVINPVRYPEAYSYHFLDNKAILLEGPPGTGKTTFAKAVAKELNQPFALVNVASLVNCYVGETAKNIDKIFVFLREYAEKNDCFVTVFFDELDEIAKRRGGEDKASEAAVPALLRNLDGVKRNKSFLILANTNRKDVLDSGILSRFRRQIYIPLPDEAAREKLLRIKLSDVEPGYLEKLDLAGLAEASEGLSGRDLTFLSDDFKYRLGRIKAGLQEEENLQEVFLGFIADRLSTKLD